MKIRKEQKPQVVAGFLAGRTLKQLGEEFGVTKQRISSLLKSEGVSSADGGHSLGAAERSERKRKMAEAQYQKELKKYGMSRSEYISIPEKVRKAYITQRSSARQRGIEWGLTIAVWCRLWNESGKFDDRGRSGGYVMARYGDVGPYKEGNVYICTCRQNILDYWAGNPIDRGRKKYELKGNLMSCGELAKISAVSKNTIRRRLERGWSVERAVFQPIFA